MIEKRIPATVSLELITFLNDKKINGELYALLQQYSIGENHETVVYKNKLPVQKDMCKSLGIKSTKTFRVHRDYLIEKGFVIDDGNKYILPRIEKEYFMIPLDTLKYLNDVVKEFVIKIYSYLGQRFSYKEGYVFTIREIGEHIGIDATNSSTNIRKINNALDLLTKLGLIEYVDIIETYNGMNLHKKKLVNVSKQIKDKKER